MSTRQKKSSIGGVLPMLVFAIFVVLLLMILLTGADIVRRLTARDRDSYDRRTAVQYLATRIHQADSEGVLSVCSFADGTALVISEDIDGTEYQTLIYCHDGCLREMFCEAGLDIKPEFGEEILPLDAFYAEDMGSHLRLTLVGSGHENTLHFMLHSRKGADR